ncbi:SulP family inorganic anion transporter [Brevibacillus brevis]|nr:SulP family inorganic anion transporter [Brevibacillus brevis]WJQ84212.1 SulP family inorganic anion transporter [Brevibacillus brevis]
MNLQQLKMELFSNVRADMLAGITVALALIPEAIAFSIIAGVDSMVGLYASFCIAVTIAFVGGRPGMISAATGAMALLMITLVKEHGIEYLFAATVLTGILQLLLGACKIGRLMTFVPHTVVLGFVNALAILIFMAQLPHFIGASWGMYLMLAGTLAIIYLLPRLTKAVPSALVAIIVMTVISIWAGLDVRTVGDMGEITRQLPMLHIPSVPLNLETLMIILPYSFPLSLVGILESLMTAAILDEMAGCAMIGQSVINVKSGGCGRLSTLVAGIFLLFLILVLGDVVKQIPMAALVGVMVMVSIGTFNWQSIRDLRKIPVGDAVVMITTVIIVVATHDLAKGVISGVIQSAVIFGWRMARLHATSYESDMGEKVYTVSGQLFFGTMTHFVDQFSFQDDPQQIIIDFSRSHVWDLSAVTAISKVVEKYRQLDKFVVITGLNDESKRLIDRVGISTPAGH